MTEQEKQVWYDALKERANQPSPSSATRMPPVTA